MSLDALRVALQGAGFPLSAISLAVQGLLAEAKKEESSGGYAKAHVNYKWTQADADEAAKNYVDRLNAEFERKLRIQRDDVLATEFIMALVQSEILNGTF